jgi:exonuclease III
VKKNKVKDLVYSHKVDFLAIQETKLEAVSDSLCHNLWGSDDCDWVFLPSIRNSGGILSIWRKSTSSLLFSLVGEGFVCVCFEWGVDKKKCFVVNVYSKCDLPAKKRLWDNLVLVKNTFGDGLWCVIGDFNAVSCSGERRGINEEVSPGMVLEMNFFISFLLNIDLIDVNPLGRSFTWYRPNGRVMSRIDRALVSESWSSCWGSLSLWALPRSISDHCPLVLW